MPTKLVTIIVDIRIVVVNTAEGPNAAIMDVVDPSRVFKAWPELEVKLEATLVGNVFRAEVLLIRMTAKLGVV